MKKLWEIHDEYAKERSPADTATARYLINPGLSLSTTTIRPRDAVRVTPLLMHPGEYKWPQV